MSVDIIYRLEAVKVENSQNTIALTQYVLESLSRSPLIQKTCQRILGCFLLEALDTVHFLNQ